MRLLTSHDGLIHEIKVGNRRVKLKRGGQKDYVNAINSNILTFAHGPAGTGKTFLAAAMGVSMLEANLIQKIVMVRPAVTAGEDLGFLPGDLQQKIDPFLKPLYDAVDDLVGSERRREMLATERIEIASVAFMRGRTLSAFVICDEAQNMTPSQMKLLLTRIGYGCKMVVVGDDRQTDISVSGLDDAIRRFHGDPDVAICELTDADNHRHPLVGRISKSYDSLQVPA